MQQTIHEPEVVIKVGHESVCRVPSHREPDRVLLPVGLRPEVHESRVHVQDQLLVSRVGVSEHVHLLRYGQTVDIFVVLSR